LTTINQSPWNVALGKELDTWFAMVESGALVVINLRCMVAHSAKSRAKDASTFIRISLSKVAAKADKRCEINGSTPAVKPSSN
jgi:hypothetical protein